MLKNLNYKIKPYPKGKNTRYDASYKPKVQLKLLQEIKNGRMDQFTQKDTGKPNT